jgi:hypothetical protein
MLWTIKYRLRSIPVYFTFNVSELSPFFSFENIWLNGTLIIIRKPKQSLFAKEKVP